MSPRRALALVALAAVLANATWFSATAVVPALELEWDLTPAGAAWMVVVVQVGFVVGSLGSAVLNLPDRFEPRRLIAGAAILAGVANLGLLLAHGLSVALPIRFVVGVALAGVYAPAVRLVSSYYERGRGLATGVVVGALTLGSGSPHLVRGLGGLDWRVTIVVTSGLAAFAAFAVRTVGNGPGATATPPLDVGAALRSLAGNRSLRLASLGYLGHMWELYALWAWLPTFYVRGIPGREPGTTEAGVVAFAAIGIAGLAGAVVAGGLADRLGRTAITSAAMLMSALCCLLSALAYGSSTVAIVVLLLVWARSSSRTPHSSRRRRPSWRSRATRGRFSRCSWPQAFW